MKPNLPDLIAGAGFVSLATGVTMLLGPAWALVICGILLMGLGLFVAWRRSN